MLKAFNPELDRLLPFKRSARVELELLAVLIQSVLSECLSPLILPAKLDSLLIGVRTLVPEESLLDDGEDPLENPKLPATEDKNPDKTLVGAVVDERGDETVVVFVVEKLYELVEVVIGVEVEVTSVDVPFERFLEP